MASAEFAEQTPDPQAEILIHRKKFHATTFWKVRAYDCYSCKRVSLLSEGQKRPSFCMKKLAEFNIFALRKIHFFLNSGDRKPTGFYVICFLTQESDMRINTLKRFEILTDIMNHISLSGKYVFYLDQF